MAADAYNKYVIPDLPSAAEVLPYLQRIDEARWYSNFGPLVCEFEEQLKMLLSRNQASHPTSLSLTTLSSGYHALEVGLHLSGARPGQRVLLPAVTFSACPLAVQHAGFEPLLADVDAMNWTLTPRIARAAIDHIAVAAVMPVATYGVPLPTSEWDEFNRDTGIPVVIDAAAAFEAQLLPQRALVAHSFHATKPFGIGEGGLLIGRDPQVILRGRQYSNFGMIDRIGHMEGTNAKMSEYHAAVGLAQLRRWGRIKRQRRHLLNLYSRYLQPLAEFASLQPSIETAVVSCLMLLMKKPIADALVVKGKQRGVALHRTYLPPLYRHPYFSHLAIIDNGGVVLCPEADVAKKQAHMPNCERLMQCLIGVPFHPFMDEADVITVIDELRTLCCSLLGA